MRRLFVVILSLGLLAAGVTLERTAQLERMSPPVASDPRLMPDPDSDREVSVGPGKSFVIDVSQMLKKLDELRFDERSDQIADWAVYGTLLRFGLSSAEVRHA